MSPELFLLLRDAEDLACRLDKELDDNERLRFDEGDPQVIRDLVTALRKATGA